MYGSELLQPSSSSCNVLSLCWVRLCCTEVRCSCWRAAVSGGADIDPDDRRVWVLMLIYAAHSATTTLPCITTVFFDKTVSSNQLTILMLAYLPYFVVPAVSSFASSQFPQSADAFQIMVLDMYQRLAPLATRSQPASTKPKSMAKTL